MSAKTSASATSTPAPPTVPPLNTHGRSLSPQSQKLGRRLVKVSVLPTPKQAVFSARGAPSTPSYTALEEARREREREQVDALHVENQLLTRQVSQLHVQLQEKTAAAKQLAQQLREARRTAYLDNLSGLGRFYAFSPASAAASSARPASASVSASAAAAAAPAAAAADPPASTSLLPDPSTLCGGGYATRDAAAKSRVNEVEATIAELSNFSYKPPAGGSAGACSECGSPKRAGGSRAASPTGGCDAEVAEILRAQQQYFELFETRMVDAMRHNISLLDETPPSSGSAAAAAASDPTTAASAAAAGGLPPGLSPMLESSVGYMVGRSQGGRHHLSEEAGLQATASSPRRGAQQRASAAQAAQAASSPQRSRSGSHSPPRAPPPSLGFLTLFDYVYFMQEWNTTLLTKVSEISMALATADFDARHGKAKVADADADAAGGGGGSSSNPAAAAILADSINLLTTKVQEISARLAFHEASAAEAAAAAAAAAARPAAATTEASSPPSSAARMRPTAAAAALAARSASPGRRAASPVSHEERRAHRNTSSMSAKHTALYQGGGGGGGSGAAGPGYLRRRKSATTSRSHAYPVAPATVPTMCMSPPIPNPPPPPPTPASPSHSHPSTLFSQRRRDRHQPWVTRMVCVDISFTSLLPTPLNYFSPHRGTGLHGIRQQAAPLEPGGPPSERRPATFDVLRVACVLLAPPAPHSASFHPPPPSSLLPFQ